MNGDARLMETMQGGGPRLGETCYHCAAPVEIVRADRREQDYWSHVMTRQVRCEVNGDTMATPDSQIVAGCDCGGY